jgi:hypothetical protein
MARALALLILGAAMPACSSAPDEPMAITDVIARMDALNGRTVRVAGYLGDCIGYDCDLFRNPNEKAQQDRRFEEYRTHRWDQPPPATPEVPALGIGPGEDFAFDRQMAPYRNSYVVITGRITNHCRDHEGRRGCTDRNTDLLPTQIEHWSPPQSQTGNRI